MLHFLPYGRFIIVHKWYVGRFCFERGLYWRGLKHDWSKFSLAEWIPYAEFFNMERTPERKAAFASAFNHHLRRNDHHWQYWVVHFEGKNGAKLEVLEMPYKCMVEMLCDWRGASAARGTDCNAWYAEHKQKIMLHPKTKAWIEAELAKLPATGLPADDNYQGDGN